jgi:uncharacterized protein DUF6152
MEVGMRTQSLIASRVLLVLAGAVVLSARLLGHHSYAEYYLEADTIEIEGEVVEFQYKNPHSWIHVQGRDNSGRSGLYAGEWASVSRLDREGITKDFIKAGDHLRIWASPSRNPNDNRIRIKRIERRSDKWKWGAGRETR